MFLQIETVNCALLQRKDQEANNGVVHIINGLLDPSYTVERDLAELLVQVSGCPKIQEVFRLCVGLLGWGGDVSKNHVIFAFLNGFV